MFRVPSVRIVHYIPRRLFSLGLANLPSPPADTHTFPNAHNLPTHVEFAMANGAGQQQLPKVHSKLYEFGDIVRFGLPGDAASVVVFDPEEMFKVHKACGATPNAISRGAWPLAKWLKDNPVKSVTDVEGEPWKRLRHTLQKGFFSFEDANSYIPSLRAPAREAVSFLPQNENRLHDYLNSCTFEFIHVVLMGFRANVLDESRAAPRDLEFVRNATASLNALGSLVLSPFGQLVKNWEQLPEEHRKKVPPAVLSEWERYKHTSEVSVKLGAEKIKELLDDGKWKEMEVAPYAARIAGESLTRQELELNVSQLMMAGIDTTANTLLWVLVRLAEQPEWQEKVRKEVKALQKGGANHKWTGEETDSMTLMHGFVEESMRFIPTAAGHARWTNNEVTLKSRRTGEEYTFPAGTHFMFSAQPMRNDPKYVDNPEKFDPTRHSRECKRARKGTPQAAMDHPYTSVFSSGPRMCLGARIARVEMDLFLAELLTQFRVTMDPPGQKYDGVAKPLTTPIPVPKLKFEKL